ADGHSSGSLARTRSNEGEYRLAQTVMHRATNRPVRFAARLTPEPAVQRGRVSVIIPTFNRASIVGRAIESALGQTYQDVEVIVVDDGSSDDTRAVVQAFGPRVRFFYQE